MQAWELWNLCNIGGRNFNGGLEIVAVIKLAEAFGATTADIYRVMQFEKIWRDNHLKNETD